MALIKCKECELPISDKAVMCPHCGYSEKHIVKKRTTKKRMRLPNGFGQIYEVKGKNLREPFRVSVTTGKTSTGKYVQQLLKPKSYFATYNEAYAALVEYNKNPYDLSNDISLNELYEKWSAFYFEKLKNDSSIRTIKSAWNYCKQIHDMRAKDVRSYHIKGCMDDCESPSIKLRIKSVFNLMLDYAVEHEIIDKNYCRTFNVSDVTTDDERSVKNSHIAFSEKELEELWKYTDNETVQIILVQCYSGWRPKELCLLKIKDVNIIDMVFIGGIKTKAGTNRLVPIHKKIRDIVLNAYNKSLAIGSEYLFTIDNGPVTYDKLRHRFNKICKEININPEHKAHDGRKTFITRAKKYNVDEYAIKYIVGHAVTDITERVYTEREITWLKQEIDKIE